MDCLKGYIGLSVQVGTAESSLYACTLPGISLYNLDKIADKSEQADASGVFPDCEQRAVQTFRSAFTAALNECYKVADVEVVECLICESKPKLAVALWYYIGHELMVERIASDRLNRFTTVDLKKAKELRDFFIDRAEYELNIAVKGVDIGGSECVEHVEARFPIQTVTPIL